jgi:hypothetical protein
MNVYLLRVSTGVSVSFRSQPCANSASFFTTPQHLRMRKSILLHGYDLIDKNESFEHDSG